MQQQIKVLTIIYGLAFMAFPGICFSDEDVWAELKKGGHVILMRHSAAEKTGDPLALGIGDCTGQRNLSGKGQRQAILIGEVFRKKSVPISEILSSHFCRTYETGELAFKREIKGWEPLDLLYSLPKEDRDARTEIVENRIIEYSGKDNLIMITHRPNIEALTFEMVGTGGSLVLKPDHEGDFEIIGIITPRDLESK